MTTHTARKTFASTVLLYNDTPKEIVSEILGHSKIEWGNEHKLLTFREWVYKQDFN